MNSSIVLVTGASSGLGKAAALKFASLGAHVVMLCRDTKRGGAALCEAENVCRSGGTAEMMLCDLASLKCINAFCDEFIARFPRLNVLVNNAGTLKSTRRETEDGYEMTFGVNHLGAFVLTHRLLPLLARSAPSRVINVSSFAHRWGRIYFSDVNITKHYSAMRGYSQSKLANLLFTYLLAERLSGTGVSVNAMDPGIVGTNIVVNRETGVGTFTARMHKALFKSPETAAEMMARLAFSPEYEGVTGKYFVKGKAVLSSKRSYDRETAKKLWNLSCSMAGISCDEDAAVLDSPADFSDTDASFPGMPV